MMSVSKFALRATLLAAVGLAGVSSGRAQGGPFYWTNAAPGGTWSTSQWKEGSVTDPLNVPWVSGIATDVFFTVANSTITGDSVFFRNLTATENLTVTAGGVIGAAGLTSTFDVASDKTLNFGSQAFFAGNFGIVKNGAGTLVLSNANSYTRGFTLNAGTVTIGNANALGNGGALTLNGGTLQSSTSLDLSGKFTGGITIGGNVTFAGANNLTFSNTVNLGSAQRTLTASGTGVTSFNGALSGSGGVLVNGSGVIAFGGSNAYTGGLTVGGTSVVQLNSASAVNSANALTMSGGTLRLNGNDVTVAGLSGSGSIVNNSASTAATLTVNQASGSATYSGTMSNGGTATLGLTKSGAGTLVLTGNNNYTGPTTISAGTLQMGNGGTSGTVGTGPITNNGTLAVNRSNGSAITAAISGTGNLTVSGGGVLSLTGNNTYSGGTTVNSGGVVQVFGANASYGTGAITNNGTVAFNRSTDMTVGNDISGTGQVGFAGGVAYTVTGNNTYSGATEISGATVYANNATSSLGTGGVTVLTGGTLAGTGTVAAPVTVQSGGTLAPGMSPGTLTVGSLTMNSGSTFAAELNGAVAGTSYDQVVSNGVVSLGGATLSLTLGYVPLETDRFFLVNNLSASPISGIFAGLSEGATVTVTVGVQPYSGVISYLGDFGSNSLSGGNDVVLSGLTAAPEPGSLALLGLLALPAAVVLRRRK